jgi:hypothetical protein
MNADERGLGEREDERFEKWEEVSNFGKYGERAGKRARRPRGARERNLHLQKEQPHPPKRDEGGSCPRQVVRHARGGNVSGKICVEREGKGLAGAGRWRRFGRGNGGGIARMKKDAARRARRRWASTPALHKSTPPNLAYVVIPRPRRSVGAGWMVECRREGPQNARSAVGQM